MKIISFSHRGYQQLPMRPGVVVTPDMKMFIIGGDSKGSLQVLDAKTGKLLAKTELEVTLYNPVCSYDEKRDKIYVYTESTLHMLCPRIFNITEHLPLNVEHPFD